MRTIPAALAALLSAAIALPADAQQPPKEVKPVTLTWTLKAGSTYGIRLENTIVVTTAGENGPVETTHTLHAEGALTLTKTEEVQKAKFDVTGIAKWKKKLHPKYTVATGSLRFTRLVLTKTEGGEKEILEAPTAELAKAKRVAAATLSDFGRLTLDLKALDDDPFDDMDLEDHLGGLMLGLPRARGVRPRKTEAHDHWVADVDGENTLYRMRLAKVSGVKGSRIAHITGGPLDGNRLRLTNERRWVLMVKGTLSAEMALDQGLLNRLTCEHTATEYARGDKKKTPLRTEVRKRTLTVEAR